jgi:hypothetical protein
MNEKVRENEVHGMHAESTILDEILVREAAEQYVSDF